MNKKPILYMIIPCFNEEKVLPITSTQFLDKLTELIKFDLISNESKILFVNDASKDNTWNIICELAESNDHFIGISQSKNRGHQNAVLAGLMEAKNYCDITISIDCDGQDDINAMNEMILEYNKGSEVVYGVRNNRDTDTFFKRTSAHLFYLLLNKLGVECVYNHADYRLVSSRVLNEFENFKEVNIYLRGMFPLVGFRSSCVYYKRYERIAGESHYSLSKMLSLAIEGITSLSIKPIRFITILGLIISIFAFLFIVYIFISYFKNDVVEGWSSTLCIVCLLGGIQLISIGILGEYIGKIYLESKRRPRYIISERTSSKNNNI